MASHTISQCENQTSPSKDEKITLQTSSYEEPSIEKGEIHDVFQANVDGVEFRTVSWQQACILFIKFNFAMSILSIPGALAALGSVGGSLCIVGFTSLNTCMSIVSCVGDAYILYQPLTTQRLDTALVLGNFKHNHPECHSKSIVCDLVSCQD